MSKRVLIITYYWPPSGGSGVQRWLKFTKYLPQYGWTPVVYSPSNPTYTLRDESLLQDISPETEILQRPIFEPYNIHRFLVGKTASQEVNPINHQKKSWKQHLSLWIRSNCFVPDPRIGWVKPSVNYLTTYLCEHPVDAIITTGPPQSMHLIGRNIMRAFRKKRLPTPVWIADFRDSWTGHYSFKHLSLLPFIAFIHKKMERSVLAEADHVITVTPSLLEEFRSKTTRPVSLITNGYDPADFSLVTPTSVDRFRMVYAGVFPADANSSALWQVLLRKKEQDASFGQQLEICLVGKIDAAVLHSIEENGLLENTVIHGYLPHAQAIAAMRRAQFVLLSLSQEAESKKVLTGKVFEYLAAHKNILALCPPNSDVATLLHQCHAGCACTWQDEETMTQFIESQWQLYRQGQHECDSEGVEQYSREKLTQQLANLFSQYENRTHH